ncbi:Plasmid replication region DNA-binding N-term [Klebsiella pneumoniae]|nr:Plasmid replication region DNA-binding N-term [Klebsiella pneumoniae]VGH08496.1 Plasmid replication region DNA-binding N-term [Klebsiella pneumoniae]VGK76440.1 Plasmid replication region DNA-binding N-term [Klebsiella pneumoniae]
MATQNQLSVGLNIRSSLKADSLACARSMPFRQKFTLSPAFLISLNQESAQILLCLFSDLRKAIAASTPNPTNEQVRQHLGGGSLSHISPVMRAFRARQREQAAEQATPLPAELAQLLTGQLGLLWQAAVKQAEAGALAAREQADDDIARADQERDEALANVAALESELAVLREQVARLTATGEHLAAQLQDTKAELKEAREDGRQLQTELLALARQDGKVKK